MKTQPACVTASGGNSTLTNQDEQDILTRTVSAVPVVAAPGGMEDDSFVNPMFRDGDVAGS